VYCICDNKLRKLNYLDILGTIYCLLSGDTELEHEQSVDALYYEEKIYWHVHRDGPKVKERQGLPEGIVKDIEDRAWKIYKIIWACKLLDGFRMAAFIGPENVGKTTLINSILGENVGVVGFTTHTSAASLYRFTQDILIIDFPGINGGGERAGLSKVWEYYEKVADLCIVVVNFGGDTSRAAEEFLRVARSRMCENVVLVINRVDSVLNGSRNSHVWVEYSPSKVQQLRISFAESCGLPTERVFLSVSRPREELEETTCHLLEERPSIMMKEEITSKLRWLLCETQANFF
jgi:GTP-binding protein EngB required for normal cell division